VKRLLAIALGTPFALLPRRFRFGAALRLAALLRRPIWRFRRNSNAIWLAGPADESLRIVLRAMVVSDIRFDPQLALDVPESFVEDLRASAGLIVTGHFVLNTLMTRYLHDQRIEVTPVKTFPENDPRIWGTDAPSDAVRPSRTLLVTVRDKLAAGRPVILAIDSRYPLPGGVAVETFAGTYFVSSAALTLVRRIEAPVWFACVRARRHGPPLLFVRRIEPRIDGYIALFREQAAAVER
jgi:hypothetical protein